MRPPRRRLSPLPWAELEVRHPWPHGGEVARSFDEACSPFDDRHVALFRPIDSVEHGGWRVIEIWDSIEDASRFLEERFGPALAELGITGPPPQPEFWPIHTILTGATST